MLGWGSSTPKDADFAKLHTPKESSIHNDALGYDGQILAQKAAGESRSIPAVHQTSDSPSTNPLPPDSEPIPNETVSSPLDQIVSPPAESPLSETFESAEAFSCIPERIGYLKEVCGIDFGWGTSSMMEFILEHIHITGGFSWTTSIILLALLNRMVIFIPQLRSSSMGAMYKAKKSLFEPIQEKMRAAAKAKDTAKFAEHRAELNALKKETGFSLMKMFLSPALQIVLQFSAFRTLRNMSALPVPAFKHENWLWAQDLTSSDPYFIIPIANSAILYLTIKVRY